LLKQLIQLEKTTQVLQQDNANVQTTRLNTMLLALENMTGELQLIAHEGIVIQYTL
jgi:hypothetical protein